MASDLCYAELVDLGFARKYLIPKRNGKLIDRSTLHRWTRRGLAVPSGDRIRLECVYIGARPMTSEAAIREFFCRLTEANQIFAVDCRNRSC
jgi:hypothetical protein